MGLMGHRREANQPTRGWCSPPQGRRPNWTWEGGATPLSFSYSLSFPLFPLQEKEKKGGRILLGPGVLVGLPLMARPLGPASSLSSFIYGGKGAP